jgi:AraC-like DNA-binding protein
VLSVRTLLDRDGVRISDVACRHQPGRGRPAEQMGWHGVVFVRRGCFLRSADGAEALLDPMLAYSMNPGEEERYDHPHDGGDDCTWLSLEASLAASIWGGEPTLPPGPLPSTAEIDLAQRLLLASGRRGADAHGLVERAIALAARVLAQADPRRVDAGRPATARARRAVADGTREALTADPDRSLRELARMHAVSPHHLSRVFHAETGHTVARYRMRLRARAALERLAGGERSLADLAADLGFADQSHLCRVLRAEVGHAPSALRRALAWAPQHVM